VINANVSGGFLLFIGPGTANITNQGLLEATSNGLLPLGWNGGVTINTGTIAGDGGSVLILTSVNNAGGTISANGAQGVVQVLNGTITGGTLTTTNGGVIELVQSAAGPNGTTISGGTATLNGVSISSGSTYVGTSGTTTVLQGTITNNGTIQATLATINVGVGNATLSGGGTLA
jgi:hypothetical protein